MRKKQSNVIKAVLDILLLPIPQVKKGRMFGYPAYYVGKKLSICIYELGVAVKIPEKAAVKLLAVDENVVPFQPMGKPKIKEWYTFFSPIRKIIEDMNRFSGNRLTTSSNNGA